MEAREHTSQHGVNGNDEHDISEEIVDMPVYLGHHLLTLLENQITMFTIIRVGKHPPEIAKHRSQSFCCPAFNVGLPLTFGIGRAYSKAHEVPKITIASVPFRSSFLLSSSTKACLKIAACQILGFWVLFPAMGKGIGPEKQEV